MITSTTTSCAHALFHLFTLLLLLFQTLFGLLHFVLYFRIPLNTVDLRYLYIYIYIFLITTALTYFYAFNKHYIVLGIYVYTPTQTRFTSKHLQLLMLLLLLLLQLTIIAAAFLCTFSLIFVWFEKIRTRTRECLKAK